MQTPEPIAPMQQLAAFALATVLTAGLVFSVGAQADVQYADALASAQGSGQQLCAAPQRSARG